MMEARAILDGARLSMERNYSRVIIESDSQIAVNFCNGNGINRSELMPICQEIREIRRAFSSFRIVSVGRDANIAVHLCAKQLVLIGRDICGSTITQAFSYILLQVIVILSISQ
jgi:ribonuclease HI